MYICCRNGRYRRGLWAPACFSTILPLHNVVTGTQVDVCMVRADLLLPNPNAKKAETLWSHPHTSTSGLVFFPKSGILKKMRLLSCGLSDNIPCLKAANAALKCRMKLGYPSDERNRRTAWKQKRYFLIWMERCCRWIRSVYQDLFSIAGGQTGASWL